RKAPPRAVTFLAVCCTVFAGLGDWKVSARFSELMTRLPERMEKKAVNIILQAIDRQVSEYNRRNPGHEIRYCHGKAVSSDDGAFEIRQLLRLALQRMNPAGAA
ncbi:MAG: hypothetical protein II697_07100, partial [Clostridia bacterium]|nr:hypothetical protein [Clostridia bacterium]